VLAESLRLAGRHDEALDALDRAAAADSRAPEPALLRARTLRAMGRGEEAGAALRQALSLDPGSGEARRGLGELALERGAVGRQPPPSRSWPGTHGRSGTREGVVRMRARARR
jgi:hypothetical protein